MKSKKMWTVATIGALLCSALPPLAAADTKASQINLPGDTDENGIVSIADAVKLTRYLTAADTSVSLNADVSGDGCINAIDLSMLKAILLRHASASDMTALVINEVCASNKTSWSDADGREPDWIELYNSSANDMDISGCGISDSETDLFKYTFPNGTVVPANGYLLVCCDDGLASTDASEHHAPFKLSASGETVYLTHPTMGTVDIVAVPAATTDITYGRYANGSANFCDLTPTPGASNDAAEKVVLVEAPVFSQESGFYDAEFQLSVTSTEGCRILYTTDGTDPTTSATAQTYNGTLHINNNTNNANQLSAGKDISLYEDADPNFNIDKGHVIRAVCVDADGNFSDVVTKSYYIGKTAAYYDDMKVISIVTDPANLFDNDTGIYVVGNTYYNWRNSSEYNSSYEEWDLRNPTNYNQSGVEWERPADIQVFEQGVLAYESSVGIRIAGNATRSNAQKSLRLYARSEYGSSKMKYAFFDALTDENGDPITEFDKVTIRNHGNDISDAKMRDEVAQDLAADMNLSVQAAQQCILFIDGEFWGFYSLKERLEDDYIESHYGIDKNNVTTLKNGEIEGDAAVGQSYIDFYDWAMTADMRLDENYQRVCDTIDMASFMDYITLQTYICNWDWCNASGTNNWQLWRCNTTVDGNAYGDGKWRYMLYDTEYSAGLYGSNETQFAYDSLSNMHRTQSWKNIGALFYKLTENETFVADFAENYRYHIENTFDYETKAKPIIDAYATSQREATCITWRRFHGSWGDKLASQYDTSIQTVHTFYRNRARYALQYLEQSFGAAAETPSNSEMIAEKDLWRLYIDSTGGNGTLTADDNGDLTIHTTEIGSSTWHVQATYAPITLKAGKQYHFAYTLRSDSNGTVSAFLQRNASPYDTFAWQQHSVGTTAQRYTQTFTATEDCSIVKAGFDCGYNTGTFYISDISLTCLN